MVRQPHIDTPDKLQNLCSLLLFPCWTEVFVGNALVSAYVLVFPDKHECLLAHI